MSISHPYYEPPILADIICEQPPTPCSSTPLCARGEPDHVVDTGQAGELTYQLRNCSICTNTPRPTGDAPDGLYSLSNVLYQTCFYQTHICTYLPFMSCTIHVFAKMYSPKMYLPCMYLPCVFIIHMLALQCCADVVEFNVCVRESLYVQ